MADTVTDVLAADERNAPAGADARPRRRFFLVMSIVLLAPLLIGFGPTFFLRPWLGTGDYLGGPSPVVVGDGGIEITIYPGGPFPLHLLLHGSALAAWYTLLLVQALLVATRRVTVHRTLGFVGVGVAVAVLGSSVVTLAYSVDRLGTIGVPPQAIQGIVVGDTAALTIFAVFVALAVLWRGRPAVHKRLMLLASIPITGPAFSTARPLGAALNEMLPGVPFTAVFFLACVVALVLRDLVVDRRVHPATGWGIAAIVLSIFAVGALIGTPSAAAYVDFVASFA